METVYIRTTSLAETCPAFFRRVPGARTGRSWLREDGSRPWRVRQGLPWGMSQAVRGPKGYLYGTASWTDKTGAQHAGPWGVWGWRQGQTESKAR